MGSSCAAPDEKRGMPRGVYLHFTHPGPPAVNGPRVAADPGEKTSGRGFPLLSRAWVSGRGAAASVSVVRGPRSFLPANPK